MPKFIDTRGYPTLGIGICDRCKRKFPLHMLHRDKENSGLLVCRDDVDRADPRLKNPTIFRPEKPLPYTRPDLDPDGPEGTTYNNQIGIITENDAGYIIDEYGNWIIP